MSSAFKKSFRKLTSAVGMPVQQDCALGNDNIVLSNDMVALLQSMPDSVSLHLANGDAVWVSDKTEETFNKITENLIGKGFLENVNPQDKLTILKVFSDCNASGEQQAANVRYQLLSESGQLEVRVFEFRVTQFKNETQQLFLASIRDISVEKTALNNATEEVAKAKKSNNTKSLFLSNMSHELRTPLNAIIGFSQMLMGEAALVIKEEQKTEYAGLINQSASHLLNIINDILDVSKIEAGKFQIIPEVIDTTDTITSTLKLMTPIANEAGINIASEIVDDLPDITADPRAIRQILMNLVANAIKFSCAGDKVKVSVRRHRRKILFEVSDNGLGMNSDTLEKLGSSFFQAEQKATRRFEGAGLGLSIVFGLVKLHDGNVTFNSKLGQGTQVCIELPISARKIIPVPSDPDNSLVFLNEAREPNLLRKLESTSKIRKTG